MSANYKPIRKDRVQFLNLDEPNFDYKSELYPANETPILISSKGKIEWKLARFGLIPFKAEDFNEVKNIYNVDAEIVVKEVNLQHAWNKNQFALIPVEVIFEPKYIDDKAHSYGIYRQDNMPFTIAAIYEHSTIGDKEILSMSILTINADTHPLMKQFHASEDEKRSFVVIPEGHRLDWLNCDHEQALEFIIEFSPDEFTAAPKSEMHKYRPDLY